MSFSEDFAAQQLHAHLLFSEFSGLTTSVSAKMEVKMSGFQGATD